MRLMKRVESVRNYSQQGIQQEFNLRHVLQTSFFKKHLNQIYLHKVHLTKHVVYGILSLNVILKIFMILILLSKDGSYT